MKAKITKRSVGIILIVIGILLACVAMFFLISNWEVRRGQNTIANPDSPEYQPGAICYKQKWYVPKRDVTTVLGIGVDKFLDETSNESYNNLQQSDVLILLVFNSSDNSYTVIHINRDTMVDIQRLGVFGDLMDKFKGQIALAHTQGTGGKDSCINTVRAVSDFMGGAPVDHYVCFTMDAVPEITDLVDGVTLTLLDDFTMHDPEMIKGTEYTLRGENALVYVRGRTELEDTSNVNRMRRQRQYLSALKDCADKCHTENKAFIEDSIEIISKYMVSDCTVNQLADFGERCLKWTDNGIIEVKGEAKKGKEFMEFYADEDALMELVLSLMYDPYVN